MSSIHWNVKHTVRLLSVLLTASLFGMIGMSPATADGNPGLWYFDDYGVQQAHDEGFTGKGVTIAIIDTPIYSDIPGLDSADITVHEPGYCDISGTPGTRAPATSTDPRASTHGTEMALLIAGNGKGSNPGETTARGVAPGAKINYYATSYREVDFVELSSDINCFRNGEDGQEDSVIEALSQALKDGADIISMSFATGSSPKLEDLVSEALKTGVILVSGTSNDKNRSMGMASFNGVVTMQSETKDSEIYADAKKPDDSITAVGPGVEVLGLDEHWGPKLITGTSPSTAITAGFLALVKSKYPSATGNQIIQSLIKNTGASEHTVYYDPQKYWGYGSMSLNQMLSFDPTNLPDINPLFNKLYGFPKYDDVFDEKISIPTTKETLAPSKETDTSILMLSISLGGILLAGGAVFLIILLNSRRKRARNSLPSTFEKGL
ncbi:hypothetical protein GCM10022198_15430 [Klugiella xanthotipulae]|uniref:Subtilase family protein n=1 Tax=Klugiella xanthotipulae TaxID=244735 RepID=A0A543HGX9_9MICO|nr:S8/S53 family peptidase [Klugiella xanthotipulae]TQM57581.1 subtilase family protein [Klugiella xanthotipulae]